MVKKVPFELDTPWIRARRSGKNSISPEKPYALLSEKEYTAAGSAEDTATIFLTNKECPFTCLMCDLWKNTLDARVPPGAIPKQIEWALNQFPEVRHVKLYNSGNFFDTQAIPREDYASIARLLKNFETVIVESHPNLINREVLKFRDMLQGELQVALGLETVHPDVLPALNKRMDLDDFMQSVQFLKDHDIPSRAFILLRPPFLTEEEGIIWAKRSVDFAFECGVECCVVIPTRAGNGALDWLEEHSYFSPPDIRSLEKVIDYGISLHSGRIFADLWDLELFSSCDTCFKERKERLQEMNLTQNVLPQVECTCPVRD